MNIWQQELGLSLQRRKDNNLYRERKTLQSAQGVEIELNGRAYLNFSSNDYLGLANHPLVVEAFVKAAKKYGVGAGASHLVVGHQRPHADLEAYLAATTGRDRAILFSSGYMANLGVIRALMENGDAIFQDKLNHASLIDAGLSSGAKQYRYRHNALDHLQLLLSKHQSVASAKGDRDRRLLAVDGVFSMDGDLAPVDKLAEFAAAAQMGLMVDDAHGFGVLGKTGGGVAEHFSLGQDQLPILMATLGKAMGVAGAFVAGSEELVETLVQHSRSYIYTTALPAACASAAHKAIEVSQSEPERRAHLHQMRALLSDGLTSIGLTTSATLSAIQPIIIGASQTSLAVSEALREDGIYVAAIRSPTVPVGTERLRVALSASHQRSDIERLLESLFSALRRFAPELLETK